MRTLKERLLCQFKEKGNYRAMPAFPFFLSSSIITLMARGGGEWFSLVAAVDAVFKPQPPEGGAIADTQNGAPVPADAGMFSRLKDQRERSRLVLSL